MPARFAEIALQPGSIASAGAASGYPDRHLDKIFQQKSERVIENAVGARLRRSG
jgi:hypothetical protein